MFRRRQWRQTTPALRLGGDDQAIRRKDGMLDSYGSGTGEEPHVEIVLLSFVVSTVQLIFAMAS